MVKKDDVLKIASLARISMTEVEAHEYADHLSKALHHFEQLSSIDTKDVEPMVTPTEIEIYLRDDKVESNFTAEEMTQNAPERTGHLFKVPPVVG